MIFRLRTKVLLIAAVLAVGVVDPRAVAQTCQMNTVFTSTSFYSFDSVTVISPEDVWATGEAENTYFAHWDGSEWELVQGPEPDNGQFNLEAISGVRTDEVWAVGQKTSGNDAVVLRWDGSSWRVVPIPLAGRASILQDVVALTDGRVFAVGAFLPLGGRRVRALLYRYYAGEWRREAVKSGDKHFGLTDVDGTGIGSKAVWAVPAGRRFALRRRSSGWVKTYFSDREFNAEDVAVAPEGSTWFVGQSERPVVYRKSSLGWERYEVPNERYPEHLFAIETTSRMNVWVAGMRIFGDRAFPYVARSSETGTFEYVRADDPGWMAFWDIELDTAGGAWAVGETSEGGIVQRAC